MAIRECTNCGETFDFPDEAWEKLSSKKRENIVCYECDWDMEPADFTFEQQCLSPAERQAEAAYYAGLDAAELRRQLALMTELVAGYEQLLDLFAPRWREWVGK
jgi:hypothetical protein